MPEVADLYVTLRSVTAPFSAAIAEAGAAAEEFVTRLEAITLAGDETAASLGRIGSEGALSGSEATASLERLAVAADGAAASLERMTVAQRQSGTVAKESAASSDLFGNKVLGLGSALEGVAKWGSLGIAGIGVAAVKMSSDFDAAMTRLGTQAGVSQDKIAQLSNGVLSLAHQVGDSPDSLAEAAYHVASNMESMGATAQQMLQVTKVAAEGAAVGGANLVDVTNALTAVVAAGIPGVQNYQQAMGVLNATVGAGDMTMQDLADAMGSGMVATVKGFGLTIQDVGATLAVFGDNNIRGAQAGTDLRMAVQALAKPTRDAGSYLQEFGWTGQHLADDMRKGGLKLALEDLQGAFKKAGIDATEQGAVITDMFGKKAGSGLNVLMDQMDRVESKYPAMQAGAGNFGKAWTTTTQTLAQQLRDIRGGFDETMIRLGQFLTPEVLKLLGLLETRGTRVVHDFGSALQGIAEGFTGKGLPRASESGARTVGDEQHGAVTVAAPALTPMQEFGKVLKGLSDDVGKFLDAGHRLADVLMKEVVPQVEKVGGGAILVGLQTVGDVLANVLAPAMRDFADFADKHKTIMTWIVDGFLYPLAIRLGLLASIKTISVVGGLAKDIVTFPFAQAKGILDQITGIKSALFGGSVTNADGVVSQVRGVFPRIRDALSSGWASLKSGGSATGDLFSGAFTYTKFQLQSLAGAFKEAGSKVASTVADWGSSIGNTIKNVMPTKLDAQLFLQSVKDAGSSVATTISGWGQSIATAVSGWASTAVSAAQDVGSRIASGLSTGLSTLGTQTARLWQSLSTAVSAAGSAAQQAIEWLVASGKAAYEAGVKAAIAAGAWLAEKIQLVATATAEALAAAGEWLLNAAMDANPIMLIVLAIAALVGAIIYAWNHFTWFREAVLITWQMIADGATWLWNTILWPFFKGIADLAMWLWHNIIEPCVSGISRGFSDALGWLEGLPGQIGNIFADAGTWLLDAGYNVLLGFWNGLVQMGNWIGSHIASFIHDIVPGPVLKVLGINSPSRVFHEIGLYTAQGLAQGINAGASGPADAARRMATGTVTAGALAITSTTGAAGLAVTSSTQTATGAAGQAQVYVTVQLDRRVLFEEMQVAALQYGRRNPTTGLTYR